MPNIYFWILPHFGRLLLANQVYNWVWFKNPYSFPYSFSNAISISTPYPFFYKFFTAKMMPISDGKSDGAMVRRRKSDIPTEKPTENDGILKFRRKFLRGIFPSEIPTESRRNP